MGDIQALSRRIEKLQTSVGCYRESATHVNVYDSFPHDLYTEQERETLLALIRQVEGRIPIIDEKQNYEALSERELALLELWLLLGNALWQGDTVKAQQCRERLATLYQTSVESV